MLPDPPPEDAMPQEKSSRHTALAALTTSLRTLHRALIDATRMEYEREHGPVNDAGQLLQLLTRHPYFGWLRPMSEFMAALDSLLDRQPILESEFRSSIVQARNLVDPAAEAVSPEYSQRYLELLQRHPELVMAHADMRRSLNAL
jgi:hypothetical protein